MGRDAEGRQEEKLYSDRSPCFRHLTERLDGLKIHKFVYKPLELIGDGI